MRAVPAIKDAYIPNMPQNNGLLLPRSITVTYSCLPGFELENPSDNTATCDYDFQSRKGAPEIDKSQIVTAIWTGYETIRCREG